MIWNRLLEYKCAFPFFRPDSHGWETYTRINNRDRTGSRKWNTICLHNNEKWWEWVTKTVDVKKCRSCHSAKFWCLLSCSTPVTHISRESCSFCPHWLFFWTALLMRNPGRHDVVISYLKLMMFQPFASSACELPAAWWKFQGATRLWFLYGISFRAARKG